MKYGEIFELTGKGQLGRIHNTLRNKIAAANAEWNASTEPEKTRELGKIHGHLLNRKTQADMLIRAKHARAGAADNDAARYYFNHAQDVRHHDRIYGLDTTKPDEWLRKKMLTRKDDTQ